MKYGIINFTTVVTVQFSCEIQRRTANLTIRSTNYRWKVKTTTELQIFFVQIYMFLKIFFKTYILGRIGNLDCYVWWTFFSKDSRNSNEYKIVPLVLYSFVTDFIQGLLNKNDKKLARSFNFTFCYINDVFSLNNSNFDDFIGHIYPIELAIMHTTVSPRN